MTMKQDFYAGFYFDADKGAGGGKGDPDPTKTNDKGAKGDPAAPTYETWYNGLDDSGKGFVESNTKGLKSALTSERDARKTAEKELRKTAAELEKGSEAQEKVLKLADGLAEETKRADFYEDAHTAGISNLKLAYHVATTDGLFDGRGNVNFEAMKTAFPELFGKPSKTPPGGAGEGAGDGINEKPSMNDFIRGRAGRKV